MSEKRDIEIATAEGFLDIYNHHFCKDFRIVDISDAPDIRCVDSQGNSLNIECTTTADRPGDIQALLGRSNSRSIEALKDHLDRVSLGEEDIHSSCLSGNVLDMLLYRLESKMKNDYGPNTALVVRDTSGVSWDWDQYIPQIREHIKHSRNPFNCGIWIISRIKDRLFRVI